MGQPRPLRCQCPQHQPRQCRGVNYNLRFPSQYVDGESGLFYNYYRTYDPKAGRYTQSECVFEIVGVK
ncbi:hypothetical protein KFZ76_02575 [Methylovulum psychrotolerans]|uniref:RHS repeat-associated core domain-containing protein n=1 Tax=Methylovulum psychrotolerans TaxID=1704499 RepID=UPI001BFF5E2E|nr:hypothetical protein [Methylovulum psychrotolerans]